MATREDWKRLGQVVIRRRVEIGYRTREAFAEKVGLSTKTLGEIERGARTSYDQGTIAVVEQALGWVGGAVRAVLDGAEVPPSVGPSSVPPYVMPGGSVAHSTAIAPVRDMDVTAAIHPPPELLWQLGLAPAPDPAPGEFTLAELLRLIHRDDFVLGVLLSRAGLGQTQMRRLVMAVRRRREEQNVELLREVADLIRDAGGVAPDPVWPPVWLVGGQE